MTSLIKASLASRRLRTLFAAAVVTAAPAAAMAGSHSDRWRDDRDRNDRQRIEMRERSEHNDRDAHGGFEFRDGCDNDRIWVEPVYRTVCDQRWVEPVYRTVTDRVWCPPVVQQVHERIRVPDKYKYEAVDTFGRTGMLRQKLVAPGHYEEVCRDVVVKPGHYDEVSRQELVCGGHYENVERQELVTPGHFERCDSGDRFSINIHF